MMETDFMVPWLNSWISIQPIIRAMVRDPASPIKTLGRLKLVIGALKNKNPIKPPNKIIKGAKKGEAVVKIISAPIIIRLMMLPDRPSKPSAMLMAFMNKTRQMVKKIGLNHPRDTLPKPKRSPICGVISCR